MAYVHSLAAYASQALNAEPNSIKHQEMLETLKKIYCNNPDDIVLGLICEVLAGRSIYGEVNYSGKHANSFSTCFNHSGSMINLREEICAWVKSVSMQYPNEDCLNLADLGCGDGRAIGQVIKQNFILGTHRAINLFLNDAQPEMLKTAKNHVQTICKELGLTNILIHLCPGFAQTVETAEEMKKFFGHQIHQVVITAVASIHHMCYDQKIILLKQLASLCPRLIVIGDANSEHDVHHLPKSPEIISHVMRFYNGVYKALRQDGAGEDVLEAARFFLGSEARNIIMNDLDKRIDYHTTAQHWIEILEKSGLVLADPKTMSCYLSAKPTRRIQSTHVDTFVFEEEALCFSLGAKVRKL